MSKTKVISTLLIIIILGFGYYDLFYYQNVIKSDTITLEDREANIVNGLVIQKIQSDTLWASRGYTLYRSTDDANSFKKVFKVPIPIFDKAYLGNSRFVRKMFRLYDLTELIISESGSFIVFAGGKIFRSDDSGQSFKVVHTLNYYGVGEGRGIMPLGIAKDSKGNIYFGEYRTGTGRPDIKVYKSSDDGLTWNPYYNFEGAVRHIHAIQYDKYKDKIWVATGDTDSESKIGFLNSSGIFTPILEGKQEYRAVSLMFDEGHIYWGMDSPSRTNYIFRANRYDYKVEQLQTVTKPVYYNLHTINGKMFMGTTIEQGKNVGDGRVDIWKSKDGIHWEIHLAFEADAEGRGHGYVRFPRGIHSEKVAFSLINTREYNESIIVLQ